MSDTSEDLRAANRHLQEEVERLLARNAELEQLVVTDPLTGIMNRRGFDEMLARYGALCRRYGFPLSLVFIDLVRFGEINVLAGHSAGDETLQDVAGVLKRDSGPHKALRRGASTLDVISEQLRLSDVRPARVGGDEFVLLLINTDAAGAFTVMRRVAEAIRRIPMPGNSEGMRARYARQTCRGEDLAPEVIMERLYKPPADAVKRNEPC